MNLYREATMEDKRYRSLRVVSVVLDPELKWCFTHQDEVFPEVGTDKMICAQHLRSPCDVDDAAVIRIGDDDER